MPANTLVAPKHDTPHATVCELHRALHYDVPVVRALLVGEGAAAQIERHHQLQGHHTFRIVAEINYGQETQALVDIHQPHAVIVKAPAATSAWLSTVHHFTEAHPDIRIALLAEYHNEYIIRQAMRASVTVFLSTSAHVLEMENAIRSVLHGGMHFSPAACAAFLASYEKKRVIPLDLTPRQLEVLRLIAESHTTKQIAHRLHLSAKTVETYRTQLMKRLGIHDVAGLVRYAIAVGLVSSGA